MATLIDRALAPGPHETVWSGTTDRGGWLPAGVYVAELTSGGRRTVRSIVRVK